MPRKVYIVGPNKPAYIRMFSERMRSFIGTKNIEDADIVLFTGGADIDPQLYHEMPLPLTTIDPKRDAEDLEAWAKSNNKIRVGICRGAQFLNVMNGGKLWQHVTDHACQGHLIRDCSTAQIIWASSTHHQMMIPGPGFMGIAETPEPRAMYKESSKKVWTKQFQPFTGTKARLEDVPKEHRDWEVLYYEKTSSLCFQPHPEFDKFNELRKYFFQKLGMTIARHESAMRELSSKCAD